MMTSPLKSWSARILEGEVEHFHASILKALNKSHPVQPCRASHCKATWWNKETEKLRREVKVSSQYKDYTVDPPRAELCALFLWPPVRAKRDGIGERS